LISGVNIQVPAEVIKAGDSLKVIANVGSGFNNIDAEEADKQGIAITNTPGHDSIASTAELAVTLMLALSRHVLQGAEIAVTNEVSGWQVMGYLGGQKRVDTTLAIVGFGQIGQYIGKLAQAFNMKLLDDDLEEKNTDITAEKVRLEEALKE